MKKYILSIGLFLSIKLLFSQNVINNESISFTINTTTDKIEFLVLDTNLNHRKPVFLWFQGSQPYPLYAKQHKEYILLGGGLSNFELDKIKSLFHVIVISPPTVPVVVDINKLSKQLQYVPDLKDPSLPSIEYQNSDYLENYVSRANEVLTFLNNQSWVDPANLAIAGHSQGTRIASRVALLNKVEFVGLFSPNPLSRITEMIRKPFLKAKKGDISWEEADKEISYFKNMSEWIKDENIVKQNPSLKSWKSFSSDPIEDWFQLKSKLYIAYGTDDASVDLCSMIPLYNARFIYDTPTIVKYNNLEHNFFSRDDVPNWKEVMNDFIEWIIKNQRQK